LRPCWSPQDPVRRRTNVPNSPIQCQCTVVELTWGPGSFLRNIATDPTVRVCVGQGLTHRLQGGTQIINRDLVRLLRKNPAATTGESEWHSLGLERPQIDSFVCSSAEDQTYYHPVPEDARETRFLMRWCWKMPPPPHSLHRLRFTIYDLRFCLFPITWASARPRDAYMQMPAGRAGSSFDDVLADARPSALLACVPSALVMGVVEDSMR
jgi:hypothetical protein